MTQKKLHAFQLEIYEKALQDAHTYATLCSPAILAYKEKFSSTLPKDPSVTRLLDITKAVHRSRFVLYGDFHTLSQSQNGFINFLEAYATTYQNRPIILALEMFKARDQEMVDLYMAGFVSERELLHSVKYAENWGFPWGHYRSVLEFARLRKIPVLCINTDLGGKNELCERDQFAAKILAEAAQSKPDHLIACLIGEYHLADQHLLHFLRKEAVVEPIVRIFSNVDQYHFQSDFVTRGHGEEYLYLQPNMFCILNASPWLKWQSYAFWEEQRQAEAGPAFDGECRSFVDESLDVDYLVLCLATKIAKFIDLGISPSELTSFNIFFAIERREFSALKRRFLLTDQEFNTLSVRARRDGYGFIPKANAIVFSDPSVSNITSATGRLLLHFARRSSLAQGKSPEDQFFRRIDESAAAIVAVKLLDPRREVPDFTYFEACLRGMERKRLSEVEIQFRTAVRAVAKFRTWLECGGRFPQSILKADGDLHHEVSHLLGQVLGTMVFRSGFLSESQDENHDPIHSIFAGTCATIALFQSLLSHDQRIAS